MLQHLFPPTIHPMIVHFPIALGFLVGLFEIFYLVSRQTFLAKTTFMLLTLTLISLVAAALAGVISASDVVTTKTTAQMLSIHKRDAVITGLIFSAAWLWQISGIKRPNFGLSWPHLGAVILGMIALAITASIGGSMVYNHGLGVAQAPALTGHTTSRRPTASGQTNAAPQAAAPTSAPAPTAAGLQIYENSCSYCHGQNSPFGQSFMTSLGGPGAFRQFVEQAMPPGAPLSASQAKSLTAYLASLP